MNQADNILDPILEESIKSLTKREREILVLLSQGRTNKEISNLLNLSPATIRNHLSTVFIKLKVKNRAQAAVIVVKTGLMP